MKNKAKKKPKENLIQSVLDDLKNDSSESSFHVENDEFESLLEAGRSKSSSEISNITPESKSKPVVEESADDKTTVLGEEPAPSMNLSLSSTKPRENAQSVEKDDHTMVVKRPAPGPAPGLTQNSAPALRVKSSVFEPQFAQAENLKIAQNRILELEKEIERLRKENEVLASAGDISKNKLEEFVVRVHQLEKQKQELRETNESELLIFKDGLLAKDTEIQRLRNKVEELESRLSNDLRKVRVRERELENRLELAKAEKAALLRAKDENILELKRKADSMQNDLENYQNKIIELNLKLELNQEQFARTVRALRIALTNLEVSDGTSSSINLAPLKKAE